jgi:Domain of unknown function (DUF4124)
MELLVQITVRSFVNLHRAALVLFSVFALTMSDTALAQFKWKDSNGRWVYSDQPPPTGVVAQPLASPQAKPQLSQKAAGNEKSGNDLKQNADDKALSAKHKAIEAAQAAKEKQDLVKKNQVACDETRANIKTMQGDLRVTMTDSNGERRFLSEQEKQTRSAAAQKDLAANCNG